MMSDPRDAVQMSSDATALLLTALAAVVYLIVGQRLLPKLLSQAAPVARAFELSLQSERPETPPAPPPPIPRRSEKHPVPRPVAAPTAPAPLEEQTAPPDAAALAAVEASPAVAEAAVSRPDLEALYAAELRTDIDRRKHPPDSTQYRLRHPYGEVRVRFVVLRSGQPQAASIVRSSGSAILDQEALQLVSSGRYPPMPAKAFVGETQHAFLVTVEFPPAHLTRRHIVNESVAA
jgi:TonB family protein